MGNWVVWLAAFLVFAAVLAVMHLTAENPG